MAATEATATAFDPIAADLRALREERGLPSFGELGKRIREQREARGVPTTAATIPRTTIYNAFSSGRKAIDPDLVWEIALALGEPEGDAEDLRERCYQAKAQSFRAPRVASPEEAPAPAAEIEQRGEPSKPARTLTTRYMWLILIGSLAINLAGRSLSEYGHIPLYLDMVGTAIAAIIVGPWQGAAVGVATSVFGSAISGWNSVPFALVEIVGALIWGYGVRNFKLGKTIPRFFLLNCLVALASSLTAVPIIVWLDSGFTGNGADAITKAYQALGDNLVEAVAWQNLTTSFMDKMLSGFIALSLTEVIPATEGEAWERVSLAGTWLRGLTLARSFVAEPR